MRTARLIDEAGWEAQLPAIERIFFASTAAPKSAYAADPDAFKERWLGRYVQHYRGSFFIAVGPDGATVGYLAGCLENPTHTRLFDDLGFYRDFAPLCDAYPCHLHINVDAPFRNAGVGAALIAAFAAQATAARAPGMHIVTGAKARNIAFYQRNGFRTLATCRWNNTDNIFMGRPLANLQT